MAQLETIKREVAYLKNTINRQQRETTRLGWEFSRLGSDYSNLRKDIDYLKEDFYYQQDYLCDLNGRVNCGLETEKRVDHLEVKIDALYENIKRVVLIFSKKCSTLFKITPRVNAKAQPGNPDIELLID